MTDSRYRPSKPNTDWQKDPDRLTCVTSDETSTDVARMAACRYGRLQEQIVINDCAGALLLSPMNVRYATETLYAAITNMHSPTRSVFVPHTGSAVLFESAASCIDSVPEFVGEQRESPLTPYFIAGEASSGRSLDWAKEVADLVESCGGGSTRIAIDTAEPEFIVALDRQGLEVVNAEKIVERAAAIKSEDELRCIAASVSVAERGLARIRDKLEPGIQEQGLWAHLAYENAANGGEWFEYALLSSGERTNPWGHECSDKVIRSGELVGVDTGMIGPYGYGADVSRTFQCRPAEPSDEQRRLYWTALENLACNVELIRAGMSFREFAEKSWVVPEEFRARRYNSIAHGVGMGNEWPHIPFARDWVDEEDEDVFEENMVMAIESCIGREDGGECVKLEDMVVVKDGTCQLLSTFPFEEELSA